MSDQSKEEYREAAHKLYMQQERQKNRNIRRKRSSSPIQSTAKVSVTTLLSYNVSIHAIYIGLGDVLIRGVLIKRCPDWRCPDLEVSCCVDMI